MPVPADFPLAYEGVRPASFSNFVAGKRRDSYISALKPPLTTPYVVAADGSAPFETIQAAVNQAVEDGATPQNAKDIVIRPGTYNEDVDLGLGCNLHGGNGFADLTSVIITGTVTFNKASPPGTFFAASISNIAIITDNIIALNIGNPADRGILIIACLIVSNHVAGVGVGMETSASAEINFNFSNVNANRGMVLKDMAQVGIQIGSFDGTVSAIELNDSSRIEAKFLDIEGAGIILEDTSSMILEYSTVGSALLSSIDVVDVGTTADLSFNTFQSNAASTNWATGLGTINSGTNNSIRGTATNIAVGTYNSFPLA